MYFIDSDDMDVDDLLPPSPLSFRGDPPCATELITANDFATSEITCDDASSIVLNVVEQHEIKLLQIFTAGTTMISVTSHQHATSALTRLEEDLKAGLTYHSMPALNVTQNNGTIKMEEQVAVPESGDWTTGMTLPADPGVRCSSTFGSCSERSSPYFGRRKRPQHMSLTSLHSTTVAQLHELRAAALSGDVLLIEKLLDGGVCVDQKLRMGWTALMFACSAAHPRAVRVLLQRKADPNAHKELFTPLMAVCASSVKDSDDRLSNNGSSSDLTGVGVGDGDADGEVVSKSEQRLVRCARELLGRGATVNAAERHRMTALMFSCKQGRAALVRVLLQAEAEVDIRDNKGWTALCWACHGGYLSCALLLLRAAADATLTTQQGQTPADIATTQHHYELASVVAAAALGTPIPAPPPLALQGSTPAAPPALLTRCTDLEMVLAGLHLSHLNDTFARHQIDLPRFLRLSPAELTGLRITEPDVQRRLLAAMADMHRKAWQPTSLATLTTAPYISLVDATSMMGNVNKHITFLEATLDFLRQQLENESSTNMHNHHLHHHTTDITITTLISTTAQTVASIGRLQEATKYLARHLNEVSQKSQHLPSDLLVSRGPDPRRTWRRSVTAATAVAAAALVVAAAVGLVRPTNNTIILDC